MAVVLVIGRGRKIHACPEGLIRICPGILAMVPTYGNIPGFAVILQSLFPDDVLHIIDAKTTIEFIILLVVAPGPEPPGPIGINISGYRQVKIIIERKIEATIPEKKSTSLFLSICRQQET
jgi:hypothetical protein